MKAERKVFGRLQNTYDPPDLIEIQTKSYNEFLQADVQPAKREEKGLQAIFHEIFPVASYDGRYVLDFVSYRFGEPKYPLAEALGDDGRILVRESGTEPVIRVMVEATSDELCEKYVDSVIDVIKAQGHIAE